MSLPENEQELCIRPLNCGKFCDKARLKGIFIEGLEDSIRRSVLNYLSKSPEADVQELSRHAKALGNLL